MKLRAYSWKTAKPLARFKGAAGKRAQINLIRNERGEITIDTTEIQRIIKDITMKNFLSQ